MRGWCGLLTILAVIFVPNAHSASWAQSQNRVVKVGVYQNKPKVFADAQGEGRGFFMDILNDVATQEGWELQNVECLWADCLAGLNDGRIDIMPDVAWSPERAAKFDFHATPVIESWSQIYSAPGIKVENLYDLRGLRVAILEGSIQLDALERLVAGLEIKVQFVRTHNIDEAFLAVKSGKADVAVSNHFFGDYFYRSYGLRKTGVVFQPASVYFATGKGRNFELLDAVEKQVHSQRANANSKYYEVLRRWMAGPASEPETPVWVYWLVGIFIGLLAISFGVTVLLRAQIRAKTAHLARANEELRNAQLKLLKSEQLLTATQEMASVGGWELDVDAQTLTWTDETFRIHGVERETFGQDSLALIELSRSHYAPEDQVLVEKAFVQCIKDGVPYDFEATFTNLAGRKMRVRSSGRPLLDDSGRVVRAVGTFMDVTQIRADHDARIRAEEELRVARRMETIGHLAAGIAHDFNNLLSAILGYTGLLLRRPEVSDQVRSDLIQVQKAGERAANLSHQLLAFGSKRTVQPRVVSMNSVVTGLEKLLRRVLTENIRIDVRLAPDAGNILIDPGQMEQVVINISVNARDAMPDGGSMVIETAAVDYTRAVSFGDVTVGPGRWVVLSIADTGIGMDEATRKRVFEPFFTTKDVGRGTGLGLATVFSIVNQGGGHVTVQTEPGKGSTFSVFLPALAAPACVPVEELPDTLVTGTGTILIVEDDADVRSVTERILTAAGYRVLTAMDGADALAMCQRHSDEVDLVLTDMVMPLVDGRGLADAIMMKCPGKKVIFMSGHADLSAAQNPLLDLEHNFLRKPFSAAELTGKIHEILVGRI